MADGRIKNSTLNICASVINRCILILFPFVTRTLIIQVLGSSYLGLSSLFTSILSVLNLTELGFGSALVFSMYKPAATGDTEKMGALLNVYKKIYCAIGVVIFSCGLLLMPFLPGLIKGTWPDTINIYVLYFIYLVNTSVSYFAFAHRRALLLAYQKSRILSNTNTVFSLLFYTVQFIFLISFHNYYLYVCILPIFTFAENIYVAAYTSKKYPEIKEYGSISDIEKNKIKDHVKGIALQKFCSASRNSFDSIVVSMYLGLSFVTIYNNYYYIFYAVHALLYQIPNAIRSSVGNSVVSESIEKNYVDFNIMTIIYVWICSVCSACLLSLYQPFMELWMGQDMLLPFGSMCLFVLYFYLLSMVDIIALYKDGAGLWWYGRYRTLIEAVANLILNFLLGLLWGINGILLATVLTLVIVGHGYGGYIVFRYYFKGKKYKEYILLELKYFSFALCSSAVSYLLCNRIAVSNLLGLFLRLFVCLIISNTVCWLILRKQKYYPEVKIFFRKILRFNRTG